MSKLGEFVWHDLATSDLAAATPFYTDVMGWTSSKLPDVDMEYVGFQAPDDDTVAAAMKLSDEMVGMGVPPCWTPCIAVEDLDAFCAKVGELGGAVANPPTQVPGGRFAVLQDPQGATFEVYQSKDGNGESTQKEDPPVGHFCWYDLNTTDWEGARSFYAALFGWSESGVMEDSPAGRYWMFKSTSGERTLGGMSNMASMMKVPPHWLCYVTVADLDVALERVKALGGQVVNGPMPIPGGERIAHCLDAQGAAFALHAKS